MICKNCGNELNDGAMFCGKCGTRCEESENITVTDNTDELQFCRNCGAELREGAFFCNQCGSSVNENESVIQQPVDVGRGGNERKYIFKNIPKGSFNVWDWLTGGMVHLCITDDMLVIREETAEKMLDKVKGIPYNEIVSFKFKLKARIWLIIITVLFLCWIPYWAEEEEIQAVIGGILIVIAGLLNSLQSILLVNVSDGRQFKIKLKRIGRKLKAEKENFTADLNQMLSGTYILKNVDKSQSSIKTGKTKEEWDSPIKNWLR
ncbi:MAG: zinc-ribbon domain-containing protein [Ruminococcus sp.]|nr:zinc-ribbon domain-containing protein [Ruminococcus sp.]